jgi:hypothetical protein
MESSQVLARAEIVDAAREILAGDLSFIEGSRVIFTKRFPAQLDDDPDVPPFIGIYSQTDALPIGDERVGWAQEALDKLSPEIERLEAWARSFGSNSCAALIRKFR